VAITYFGPKLTVSYEEAAGRLGVSRRTVDRLVASGDLPTVRVRDRSRIPIDALDAYYRRLLVEGETAAAKKKAASL